jgi:hypothetical protein
MSIIDAARDLEGGVQDTTHAEYHTWIVLVNPGRVGKQDSINVTNEIL